MRRGSESTTHRRRSREHRQSLPLLSVDRKLSSSSSYHAYNDNDDDEDSRQHLAVDATDPRKVGRRGGPTHWHFSPLSVQIDSVMKRISATQQQLASMMEDLKEVAKSVAASSSPSDPKMFKSPGYQLHHKGFPTPAATPSPPHHHHHHHYQMHHSNGPWSPSALALAGLGVGGDDGMALSPDNSKPDLASSSLRRLSISSNASAVSAPPTYSQYHRQTPTKMHMMSPTTQTIQGGNVFVDPDDEVTMSPRAVAAPMSPWTLERGWTPPPAVSEGRWGRRESFRAQAWEDEYWMEGRFEDEGFDFVGGGGDGYGGVEMRSRSMSAGHMGGVRSASGRRGRKRHGHGDDDDYEDEMHEAADFRAGRFPTVRSLSRSSNVSAGSRSGSRHRKSANGNVVASTDDDDDSRLRNWTLEHQHLQQHASVVSPAPRRLNAARSSPSLRRGRTMDPDDDDANSPVMSPRGTTPRRRHSKRSGSRRKDDGDDADGERDGFEESFDKMSMMLQSLIIEAKMAVSEPTPVLDLSGSEEEDDGRWGAGREDIFPRVSTPTLGDDEVEAMRSVGGKGGRRRSSASGASGKRGHIRPLVLDLPKHGASSEKSKDRVPEPRFDDDRLHLFKRGGHHQHHGHHQNQHHGLRSGVGSLASPLRQAWSDVESPALDEKGMESFPFQDGVEQIGFWKGKGRRGSEFAADGAVSPFCVTAGVAKNGVVTDTEDEEFFAAEAGMSTDDEGPRRRKGLKTARFGPVLENVSDGDEDGDGDDEEAGAEEESEGSSLTRSRASSTSSASTGSGADAESIAVRAIRKVRGDGVGDIEDLKEVEAGADVVAVRKPDGVAALENVVLDGSVGANSLLLVNLQVGLLFLVATSAWTIAKSFGARLGFGEDASGAALHEGKAASPVRDGSNGKRRKERR
ncbi:hypothetical protein HDU97_004147 [Phlyctochytrium planicorne]|nr:hypothetical protein HDU97_004147 [Phlyctochytrium planicorne]